MKTRVTMLGAAIAVTFELGCAPRVVTVGAIDVASDSAVRLQGRSLAPVLAPATPDSTRIEARGFPLVDVRAFRTTLRRAFERAFVSVLPPASPRPVRYARLRFAASLLRRTAIAWPEEL